MKFKYIIYHRLFDSCEINAFSNSPIKPDQTIRLFSSNYSDFCVFKKYASYNAGDEIWFKPCDVNNANQNKAAKFKWSYNSTSNQIESVGAKNFFGKNLCWQISNLARFGKGNV